MTIGKTDPMLRTDTEESGIRGVKADGEMEGSAFNPLGNPGVEHWQAAEISKAGLEGQGDVFFAAVEMTRMPMLITDPRQEDNPIVFANGALRDLTGYQQEELLGRNCRMLQGPDTDPNTVAELRRAIREQRAVAVDIVNYKADGTPFWNGLYIGPIFDRNGELLYFFASQLDITARRSTELSTIQAQKMEAIGQLTAGLAHDFNNLLQVAAGNQELAIKTIRTPELALKALERSGSALQKASKLTQQLLSFARKQRLSPKRISINDVVMDFSEILVTTLGSRIQLHLDLKAGLPPCELDQGQLEMALLNILLNAKDAMPSGGKITVATCDLRQRDEIEALGLHDEAYLKLCVIDEGVGMPAEIVRRAVEPFFTTKGPGTGLGLAMAHGFVEQSSGRLTIRSEVGVGTTVTMVFPIESRRFDVEENGHAPSGTINAEDAPADRRRAAKTILVVDDTQDVRELASSFLSSSGYRILSASSGEAAIDLLAKEPVNLVFTDVIMPGGMNGLQLLHHVQQHYPRTAVLAATGYMDELPDRKNLTGEVEILVKPYKLDTLLEKIRHLI